MGTPYMTYDTITTVYHGRKLPQPFPSGPRDNRGTNATAEEAKRST